MKSFQHLSIKHKLIVLFLAVSVLAIGTGFGFVIMQGIKDYKNDLRSNILLTARLVGEYCVIPLTFQSHSDVHFILEKLEIIPMVTGAVVYDQNDQVFSVFGSIDSSTVSIPLPTKKKVEYRKGFLEVFQPIVYQDRDYGTLYIRASSASLDNKIREYLQTMVVLFFALVLLSYGIASQLQKLISRPILELARVTKQISKSSDYSVRVEKRGNDEIGVLHDEFNQMLEQIQIREGEVKTLNIELERRVQARTAELAVALKELETFSYSVSHDLRAPLRALDGFSQALIEDYEQVLDEQGKDFAQRIRAAANRMGNMIDDLLKLSRVTRHEIKRQEVALSEITQSILVGFRQKSPERKAEFIVKKGLKARGDRGLLTIVLENMLGNAWNYTSNKDLTKIEFGEMLVDGDNVFFIRDNGAGFDMRYADKLFGAFQRLHRSDEFEGTGIGLATVKRIINRHGGRIWAEAHVDRGATFFFTIER